VVTADAQRIAPAVGDDKHRAFVRKVTGAVEEVEGGLEDGATAAFDGEAGGDLFGPDVALVVGLGVAEPLRAPMRLMANDGLLNGACADRGFSPSLGRRWPRRGRGES